MSGLWPASGLSVWPATGRWRVHRYLEPRGGHAGRSAYRWAVISPAGRHVGSSSVWQQAQEAAVYLARHEGEPLWR